MTIAVIIDEMGVIVGAATQKLQCTDALQGEALTTLLASCLATSLGCRLLVLEGEALLVVLAINHPSLFSSWNFANCIADVSLVLSSFQSWNTLKVCRSANFRAHALSKLVASHFVFGSIPIRSPILFSILIRNGKDFPL